MTDLKILSSEQINEYVTNGILVVPSVLTSEEVASALNGFSKCLFKLGLNDRDLETTACAITKLSSTNGSGGVLDIFYDDWKLLLNEHPKIVSILQDLWLKTYAEGSSTGLFSHPFGPFNPGEGYMYIDRVCYRLPSTLCSSKSSLSEAAEVKSKKKQLQRPLGPHLDCCPHNMHTGQKWRPIQAFIALTDTLEADQGGFEACPGMHVDFHEWAAGRQGSASSSSGTSENLTPPCVGQFTPIRPLEDRAVIERFRPIACRAGDLVCWDYRIPHANARLNTLDTARQVVYIGLLPPVELNRLYAADQLTKYTQGVLPSDQWHSQKGLQHCDFQFSALGRKLMGIDQWSSENEE